jgi:hypothetical protein
MSYIFVSFNFTTRPKTPELEPRTHRSAAAKNNILSSIADNTERNII